jgi:hypothetical protein
MAINTSMLDNVSGGVAPGNLRLLLTVEYAITRNILVGVRGGLVLSTYTGTAAIADARTSPLSPFHLEARGTYVFGKDALVRTGLFPYATLGGGYAPWDTKVPGGVTVVENPRDMTMSPSNRSVDAWNIAGPLFVTAGGGIRYAFSTRAAVLVGARASLTFGGGPLVPAAGLETGVQFGLF